MRLKSKVEFLDRIFLHKFLFLFLNQHKKVDLTIQYNDMKMRNIQLCNTFSTISLHQNMYHHICVKAMHLSVSPQLRLLKVVVFHIWLGGMIYAGGTGLTIISEITELGKIKVAESCLTSSILLAEIRKSPDVSQSDAESENRQEKLGWTVPLLALLQNIIK